MKLTAHCLVKGSDQGTCYFLKCRKGATTNGCHLYKVIPADAEQYPWESDGRRRKCTYPHCKSNCSKRSRINNFQNISLQLTAKNQHNISEGGMTGEDETVDFINLLMSTASN